MLKIKFSPKEAFAEIGNNLTKIYLIANGTDEQVASLFGGALSGFIKGISVEHKQAILNCLDEAIRKAWIEILSAEYCESLSFECIEELNAKVLTSTNVFEIINTSNPVSELKKRIIIVLKKYTDWKAIEYNIRAREMGESLLMSVNKEIESDGILKLLKEIQQIQDKIDSSIDRQEELTKAVEELFGIVISRLESIEALASHNLGNELFEENSSENGYKFLLPFSHVNSKDYSFEQFYLFQKKKILNSYVLPGISKSHVSFEYLWPDLLIDSTLFDLRHKCIFSMKEWRKHIGFTSNILILGEPGSGKSTLLKYIVVTSKLEDNIVYVAVKDIVETIKGSSNCFVISNTENIAPKVVIFDGIDEAGKDFLPNIFDLFYQLSESGVQVITSVRTDFFERHIHNSISMSSFFSDEVEIQEWRVEQGLEFISNYSKKIQQLELLSSIKGELEYNNYYKSILTNPFRTALLAFVFTGPKRIDSVPISNAFLLYEQFYRSWISQEKNRGTSKVQSDMILKAHQTIAFNLFSSKRRFPLNHDAIPDCNLPSLIDDTAFSGILVIEGVKELYATKFIHETLQEFFVARLIIDIFTQFYESFYSFLSITYGNNINLFVRAYFESCSYFEKERMIKNLSKYYKMMLQMDNSTISDAENIRTGAQIIYYIGRIPVSNIPEILTYAYHKETNSIVRHSVVASLIMNGDEKTELNYIALMKKDTLSEMENRSMHLVYFGDVDDDMFLYKDIHNAPWNKTKAALVERLSGSSNREKRLRLRDLFTLKSFVNSRGLCEITEDDLQIICLCDIDFDEDSEDRKRLLLTEKKELLTMLNYDN